MTSLGSIWVFPSPFRGHCEPRIELRRFLGLHSTKASNGPLTPQDEGLSYIEFHGTKALLKEAIETIGDQFLGAAVMQKYGGWNLLCKFFDNLGPIPHHLHQNDEFAARVGQKGKPEA